MRASQKLAITFTGLIAFSPFTGFASTPSQSASIAPVNQVTTQVPLVELQAPIYPQFARRRGIEGVVRLSYSVNEKGKAVNIRSADSKANYRLYKAAKLALQQSTFEITYKDGEAVTVEDQIRQFKFELEAVKSKSAIASRY